jgi:hydroxymethylpyrimidine pyrophosphatase-like HAD family hydrolase
LSLISLSLFPVLHLVSIRLLALDIDGTLLDSHGRLPPGNLDAVTRAHDAGIEVVLATGRRFDFARPIFEQLPRPLTLILSNGAIVKTCAGDTLLRHLLPREIARAVLASAPRHRHTAALLFDRAREGQIVYERVDWDHPLHNRFFSANRVFISELAPLEDALTEDPLQLMFTGGCREMRVLFETLRDDSGIEAGSLEATGGRGMRSAGPQATPHTDEDTHAVAPGPARHGMASYSVALTEYLHRDFSLVDVIQAGCSKGAALAEWAARRGIAPAAVMAIGDNLNDLQMLEFAGHPVVMGNALEELKGRGWPITATNDECGVAKAIEEAIEI